MHTVDLLDEALEFSQRLGYRIRHEYLGGAGGGGCEIRGQKWIFLDLTTNATEQLGIVVDVLRRDPSLPLFPPPRCLGRLLNVERVM